MRSEIFYCAPLSLLIVPHKPQSPLREPTNPFYPIFGHFDFMLRATKLEARMSRQIRIRDVVVFAIYRAYARIICARSWSQFARKAEIVRRMR